MLKINSDIYKFWEERSIKYNDQIEGVLPKSFPRDVNLYLDSWMYEKIKSEIKTLKQKKILDLGCGYGRISEKILKEFPKSELRGVDISGHYVSVYNKKLHPRGKAEIGDIRKLSFKDSSFDLVFMVTTLMYISEAKDQEKVINEIFRVLKKDGKFVIIERNLIAHNLVTLFGLIEKIRGKTNKEIPAVSINSRELTRIIEKNGGKVEKTMGLPFWTLFLPILIIFSFNKNLLLKILEIVKILDKNLGWILTPSLYIGYIGSRNV